MHKDTSDCRQCVYVVCVSMYVCVMCVIYFYIYHYHFNTKYVHTI